MDVYGSHQDTRQSVGDTTDTRGYYSIIEIELSISKRNSFGLMSSYICAGERTLDVLPCVSRRRISHAIAAQTKPRR